MKAIRSLGQPAFTWGEIIAFIVAITAINGIQSLTHIADAWTFLMALGAGFVIASVRAIRKRKP